MDLGPWMAERRHAVEEALDRALLPGDAQPAALHRAMRYSVFAGGKRIRPLLVFAAAEAVEGEAVEVRTFACAVEMIHTYSLIHDDLPAMDNDDLRRGKPTCHKAFGEAIAILAGDALLTRAFHLLADEPLEGDDVRAARRMRAIAVLGQACGAQGLIGGQVLDLEAEGHEVAAATVESIHRGKTGALLTACVRGAAILTGASPEDEDRLSRFGSSIGLAFQVVDDILDETGEASQLGKTAGKDRASEKATYVKVHGIEGSRAVAQQLFAEALDAVAPFGSRRAALAGLARLIVDRHA